MNLVILLEWDGIYILACVVELRSPNTTNADVSILDELLVVDYGEVVALLYAEEIDSPLIYVLHFCRKCVGQTITHNSSPERRLDGRRAHLTTNGDILFALAYGERVILEAKDDIFDYILLVDEVVQFVALHRIGCDKSGIWSVGTNLLEREYILRQLVKCINLHRRDAVLVENLTHRNTLSYGVALDFVVVGNDSIKYCVLNLLLLRLGCSIRFAAR